MLYERHNFLNKNIEYLVSNEIIEYDIKSAGFNLIKKYKLLDESKVNYLESLGKKQRQVQIGLYQRNDVELKKNLNDKFIEIRKWFFEQNNIEDDDVLSIKKDAIVTLRRCLVTEFDNIQFIEKNVYTSYYYLNELEFYYNKDVIHVKGISDDLLELHGEYMLDFLHNFFLMRTAVIWIAVKLLLREKIAEVRIYYWKRTVLNIFMLKNRKSLQLTV
jgi:hypothetical protein